MGSSRSENTIDELVNIINTLIFDIKIIHEENSTSL